MTPHRSTPPPTRAELQGILDRVQSAWVRRGDETWEAFVRRKAPPEPPFFHVVDRARHQLAMAEALRIGEQHTATPALFVPLWIGSNEDDVPSADVWRRHLVVVSGDTTLLDVEDADGPAFWAQVELTVTTGAMVVASRHLAPDIPVKRFGLFAVTVGPLSSTVEIVSAAGCPPPAPAPTRVVPAFSTRAAPAIEIAALPALVEAAVAAVVRHIEGPS